MTCPSRPQPIGSERSPFAHLATLVTGITTHRTDQCVRFDVSGGMVEFGAPKDHLEGKASGFGDRTESEE